MACSLDQRRGLNYPSVTTDDAILGFNVAGGFTDRRLLQMAAEAGATMVRVQHPWNAIENYATGDLSLPANIATGLDNCAEFGLRPIMVAGYGPPGGVLSSPLLTADAPVGSYTLQVSPATAVAIDPPFCHIMKFPNTKITAAGKWGFLGSLIHSVDPVTGILTLAAKTTVALTAGTKMYVQRYRYASLPDKDPANPGVVAFVRMVEFLASEMAARDLAGFVNIWNEPPWLNDRWDNRAAWYDVVPAGLVVDTKLTAIVAACLKSRPPGGVRYINSGPSKTSSQSYLFSQSPQPLAADVQLAMPWESIHTYHVNPEGFLWDFSGSDGTGPWAMNPGDIGGNFRLLPPRSTLYAGTHGGVTPRQISTECGTGNPTGIGDATSEQGHAARARYDVRRVLTQWGCRVPPVIYSLAVGAVFDVVNRTTYETYPAYLALQRLMALVAHVGAPWPAVWAPSVVGVPSSQWPATFVTVHGQAGAVLFGWQRTYSEPKAPVTWGLIPHPDPISASVSLTPGSTIAECVNVVTGATVTPTVDGSLVTLPLTDEAVALRVVGS